MSEKVNVSAIVKVVLFSNIIKDGSNGHLNIILRVMKSITLLFFTLGQIKKMIGFLIKLKLKLNKILKYIFIEDVFAIV